MIKTDEKGNIVACITTKEDLDYTNFDLETIDYYDNFLIPSYEEEIERQKEVIKGMIDNEEKYCLEINRLNNIINKIEEHFVFLKMNSTGGNKEFFEDILDFIKALKELKGSEK